MTILTSTMRMQLDASGFVSGAKQLADAVEKDVKRLADLKAALKESGASDRLQASLVRLGAGTPQIEGMRQALEKFRAEQGLVGVSSARMTSEQRQALRTFESVTTATIRQVIAEDKRLTLEARVQGEARSAELRREEQARVEAAQQAAAATLAVERRLAEQIAEQDRRTEDRRIALLAAAAGARTAAANRDEVVRGKIEAEVTSKLRSEVQRRIAVSQEEAVALARIAEHEKELRVRAIEAETAAIVAARHRQADAEAHAMQHAQDRAGFRHFVLTGAAAGVSAHAVVSTGENVAEKGAELNHTRIDMQGSGMTPAEIVRIEDKALALSKAVGNVSQTSLMDLAKELRSVLSDPKEVLNTLDPLARAKSVLDAKDKSGEASHGLGMLVKGAESIGAAQDPERLAKLIDAYVKAIQVMGHTINPEQIYEFDKYAKTAGARFSDRFIMTTGLSLAQEMGGSTAGNDIAQVSKAITSGMPNKHAALKSLAGIGMIDPANLDYLKTGEVKGLKPGVQHGIKGDDLAASDLDKWVYDVLLPHMEAAGMKTETDQLNFISKIFTGTQADVVGKLITQRTAFENHAKLYPQASGVGGVDLNTHDVTVGLDALSKSIGNLSANVSAPVMDPIAVALSGLAGWINTVAETAKAHPAAAVTTGAAVGGAGLAASGWLSYKMLNGFGLGTAATALDGSAAALTLAAERLGAAGAVKAAEDAVGGAVPGFLKKVLPWLGPVGLGTAAVGAVLASGDPNKALLSGGRPDVQPQDNNLGLPGFAEGGYTGSGGRDQPAGVVHKGEFVLNAGATARHRALLEAINRGDINLPGFADGGMVGALRAGTSQAQMMRVILATDSSSAAMLRDVVEQGFYNALRRVDGLGDREITGNGEGGGTANLRYGRGAGGGYRGTPGTGQSYETGPHVGLGRMGAKFAEKAPVIMDGLIKKYGLTREQAAGVVGNLGHESAGFSAYHEGGKPSDKGGVGWAQWTGPRRRAFETWTQARGLNPTSDEASWRYLTEGDPETGKAIAAVKRQNTVSGSMQAFEGSFERAGIKAYGSRMGYANAAMNMQPAGATVMSPAASEGPAAGPTTGAHLADLKKAGVLTDEQCVTLAMASVGIQKGSGVAGANVHDWRRGAMADSGRLTPGTPVATFLDRDGRQNKEGLYAGGGAGTPGAHLDHAGVFQKYLKDEAGKIVGMTIAEQYQGSGGVHDKDYRFGEGWGEGNASNYAAVTLKGGGYLGGAVNPMEGGSAARPDPRKVVGTADIGSQSRAVDILDGLVGADDKTVAKKLGATMHVGEWCADAVNASLEKAGIKGTGSAMSDSFKSWGAHIPQNQLKRGDVIVESGRRPNGEVLGHAGFATGMVKDRAGNITTADKARGGITAIGMTSGNHGDQVVKDYWENPDLVTDLRRAIQKATTTPSQNEPVGPLGPKKASPAPTASADPAAVDVAPGIKVAGLDDLREAHAHVDALHRKIAGLGSVNLKVRHEGFGSEGRHAPGAMRTALNGSFTSDGRTFS